MRDKGLQQLLVTKNMLFSVARWPNGHWHVKNISPGYDDVYKLLTDAEEYKGNMALRHREIMRQGAAAHEYVILRPTWNEIEEFIVTKEDLP